MFLTNAHVLPSISHRYPNPLQGCRCGCNHNDLTRTIIKVHMALLNIDVSYYTSMDVYISFEHINNLSFWQLNSLCWSILLYSLYHYMLHQSFWIVNKPFELSINLYFVLLHYHWYQQLSWCCHKLFLILYQNKGLLCGLCYWSFLRDSFLFVILKSSPSLIFKSKWSYTTLCSSCDCVHPFCLFYIMSVPGSL